jgi:cobalt-zinc-cadmium efflux system outer membrane protein
MLTRHFYASVLTVGLVVSTGSVAGAADEAAERPLNVSLDGDVPSLARLLAMVRAGSPLVQLGRADVLTAKAGYAGSRLAPVGNPYVELLAERPLTSGPRYVGVGASMWVPVELFGQRSRRIAETDALVVWSETGLAHRRALAVGEAIRGFGAAAVFEQRLGVIGELMDVATAEAEMYEARRAEGDATIQDGRLARVEVARYAVLKEEARADLVVALSGLGRLAGARFERAPRGVLRPPEHLAAPARVDESPALAVPRSAASYYSRVGERAETEGLGSVSLIVSGGRNDFGEARIGGGVGYAFPVLRRNQGEVARAEAERGRALTEVGVLQKALTTQLNALRAELGQVRSALSVLDETAVPAASAAVDAAVAMREAGKGEHLLVLTSRRDLALLRLRKLDLVQREWDVVGAIVAITGKAGES